MSIQQFILSVEQQYNTDNKNMRKGQFIIDSFLRDIKPLMRIPQEVNCYYDDRLINEFYFWVGENWTKFD